MRIHFRGFKCYQDKEFEFPDGQLLLFSGPSGIGKSTVFQGIYWCQYGTLRNVYSNVGPPKCSVLIQFSPDFTIFRQASPRLLQVTLTTNSNSTIYEDQVAQQIINERFGSPLVFLACCYLQQDEKCSLLSKGFSERTDILNSISFSGENPERLIAMIDENLKALTVQSSEQEQTFKVLCEQFAKELEDRPIEPSTLELEEPLDTTLSELTLKQQELSKLKTQLEKELVEQTKIQGILENLKKTRLQLETNFDAIPLVTSLDIQNLEHELDSTSSKIPLVTEYTRLNTLLIQHKTACDLVEQHLNQFDKDASLSWRQIDTSSLTEHQAWTYEKQEKDNDTMNKLAKVLNIPIQTESDIQMAVEQCQNQFTQACLFEKAFASYSHFQTICKHLQECQTTITSLEAQHLDLTGQLSGLESQKSCLTQVDLKPLETRISLLTTLESQSTLKKTLEQAKVQLDQKLQESSLEQSKFSESKSNLEQVKTIIHYLENLKQLFQDYGRIAKLISELQISLQALNSTSSSVVSQSVGDQLSLELSQLTTKSAEFKKASDVLPCPHCSKGVKYFQGKLHACQESCVSQSEIDAVSKELQLKTRQLAEFRAAQQKDSQAQTRRTTISAQLEEKESQLHQISTRITSVSSNLSIPDLTSLESVLQALKQCLDLQSEYLETETQCKKMQEYYNNLTFETRSNESQLQRVNIQLDQCLQQLNMTKELDPNLNIMNLLTTVKQEYEVAKQTNTQFLTLTSQIDKLRSLLNQVSSNLNVRQKMFEDLLAQKSSLKDVESFEPNTTSKPTPASELKARLTRISGLVWSPAPPMSSKLAFKLLERKTKLQSLEKIEQEFVGKFPVDFEPEKLEELKTRLQKLKTQLEQSKTSFEKRTQLQKRLFELTGQIDSYTIDPTLDAKVLECSEELRHVLWLYDQVLYTQKMKLKQANLTELQDACIVLQENCTALSKLKHIAVLTECQQLQSVVDSINACMELVFRKIFDDPITVRLRLFKTLKSDGRTKPNVNLSILYKGAEYDSISQLSGGESARISMGVVLALNRVVGGNLLMLDECFGGLNGDLREESLKCIRQLVNPGTTVLVISHEDNEADYDLVIPF